MSDEQQSPISKEPKDQVHSNTNSDVNGDANTDGEHKEGLIHRSYHMLFVIYAPLALISIVLNVFSDKYIDYVYMTAFLAACLSVVLAVVMWWLFWKHREIIKQERKARLPYIIRHQFIMLYLPIAFISMGTCAYYVYDKYVKIVEEYNQTALTNITLLIPIKNQLGKPLEDIQQIKLSLGNFFINNPEVSNRYHFAFVDHSNHYNSNFEQAIVTHLKSGTDYFICAYSDVCSTLAGNLDALVETAGVSHRPIMVTTLSSSMKMPLAKNQFYRFYVRNREDAQVLAKYAFEKGVKTASFVATDDAYGRDAVEEFSRTWRDFGGLIQGGVYVDPLLVENVASEKIQQNMAVLEKSDAVFVALYQPATKGVSQLSKTKLMLLSANYQHRQLDVLEKEGAVMENVIVSFPRYKAETSQLLYTAGMFVYTTLNKLIDVDKEIKNGSTFHDAWMKTDNPAYLTFQQDGENDFSISMNALPYKELLMQRK